MNQLEKFNLMQRINGGKGTDTVTLKVKHAPFPEHEIPFNGNKTKEEQLTEIIDNLTEEQEDKLKDAHGNGYMGLDDDMPDAFEAWLEYLSLKELKEILK